MGLMLESRVSMKKGRLIVVAVSHPVLRFEPEGHLRLCRGLSNVCFQPVKCIQNSLLLSHGGDVF